MVSCGKQSIMLLWNLVLIQEQKLSLLPVIIVAVLLVLFGNVIVKILYLHIRKLLVQWGGNHGAGFIVEITLRIINCFGCHKTLMNFWDHHCENPGFTLFTIDDGHQQVRQTHRQCDPSTVRRRRRKVKGHEPIKQSTHKCQQVAYPLMNHLWLEIWNRADFCERN